jgi:hypothetical protein
MVVMVALPDSAMEGLLSCKFYGNPLDQIVNAPYG